MWIKFFLFFLFLQTVAFSAETVYCIHGFLRKPSSMQKMAAVFKKEGYEVNDLGYPSREKSIQEHAEDLVVALQKTAEENPGELIHFVTHSLGGIILRAALNHPDCPEEAKKGRAVPGSAEPGNSVWTVFDPF